MAFFSTLIMGFVCFNGKMAAVGEPLFAAENRGFKYGDGLFETMKIHKANILLAELHFERLFDGLQLLKIKPGFDAVRLQSLIAELCGKNNCSDLARVRLAVYRETDNSAGFLIEAVHLPGAVNDWKETGFVIDIFPYARKAQDAFANLKTANFLPYVLAELHAKEQGLDDCVVLNGNNCVSDTSKANLFLVKNGEVTTPALHQGCINGVMRRFLIDQIKRAGFTVHLGQVSQEDLLDADEVFVTNAIIGVQPVRAFRDKIYASGITRSIHQLMSTIYL